MAKPVRRDSSKIIYKNKKQSKTGKYDNTVYTTFNGHKLTIKEAVFIDEYVATGNASQSVEKAGYKTKAPYQYGATLIRKPHIKAEIEHRMQELKANSIADAAEILEYFTKVMRGEEKDQFGLEAPLGERTKAAQELAKRKIDIPNKLAGQNEAVVTIKLDWGD